MFLVISLPAILSPFCLEYPGTACGKVAVITPGGDIEVKPFGVIEPLVEGKVVRLPSEDSRLNFFVRDRVINSVPFVEISGFSVDYKVVDIKKYIKVSG